MNNYYNPMQSRVDSLMQQKAMIEQQLQSLQQMNVPNININNIPSNPTPSNFDFNGKWVDGEEQARNVANNNLPLILFDNNNPVFYMKNMDGAFKKFKFEEIKEEKVENTNNERMDMLEVKMDTILKALQGEASLDLELDGEIIGGTRSIYTVATASALGNVDGSTLVQVPCGASYVISLGNNSALPLTVQDANIIIKKIA